MYLRQLSNLRSLGLADNLISINRKGLLPRNLYTLIWEDQNRGLSVLNNLPIAVEVVGCLKVSLRVVWSEVTVDLTVHQLASALLLNHRIALEILGVSSNRNHVGSRLKHLIPVCDGLDPSNSINAVQFIGYLTLVKVPRVVAKLIDGLPE